MSEDGPETGGPKTGGTPVLVFGRTGQVAQELQRLAPAGLLALDRAACDLRDTEAIAAAIAAHAPAAVINAAAHTAVDRAESEPDLARAVNAAAPGAMARACAAAGIPLVTISTDYVFDGSGGAPWKPDDPTGPLGVYGATKLAGEEAVRAAGGVHAILRTSWVFSAQGSNFVRTMLRLGAARHRSGEVLRVVEDQIGGPTPASGIAAACLTLAAALRAAPEKTGTYHYAGTPDTSWKGFAETIFARAGLEVAVSGIPARAYPTPAARPANSRLDCTTLAEVFGIARPDWRPALDAVLDRLGARSGAGPG